MSPSSVYTVSQVSAYIKSLFAEDLLLADLWLSGEISNFKQAASGHCYFTLKDATSCIRAVIWRTQANAMHLPREGDAVVAHGYVSVYEPRGDYQFYVDALQPGGIGWLWQEFQRLKTRLEAEGLFEAERKRPIPTRPLHLGIVTSPAAAALRDILRTLSRRFPLVSVLLAPCAVQGDAAPASIVTAIQALNRWSKEREPLDAIIVARGGGSLEELWAFNDERVARAIAGSSIPVITGVGHETDFTIADFVADLRAPTPTGAATAAVPDMRELRMALATLFDAAQNEIESRLEAERSYTQALATRLERLSPERRIAEDRQRLDELQRRAALAIANRLATWHERVQARQHFLEGIHPANVMARGYAIVTRAGGEVVNSRKQVTHGERIRVQVSDGTFEAEVAATKAPKESQGEDK
jgi:exodeoxyribonuclease VII large subunit